MTSEFDATIQQVCLTYNLPFDLVKAQVEQESGGDPWAFRYEHEFFERYVLGKTAALAGVFGPLAACSYGLLQVILETAYEIGYTDRPEGLFVPRVALAFGAKQMRRLWDKTGGTPDAYRTALAAYNAGLGNIAGGQAYATAVYAKAGQ